MGSVETNKKPLGGSKVGRIPIHLPSDVQLTVSEKDLKVKGPKGELNLLLNSYISLDIVDNTVTVKTNELFSKEGKAYHGLYSKLIANMVTGVSKGFQKPLLLVGTGYRAKLNNGQLEMNLGCSHPVIMDIPEGIQCSVEDNSTKILIEGIDKEKVGQFAANIKKQRKPEPYKGKGIRYANETIKRKAGKSGKK